MPGLHLFLFRCGTCRLDSRTNGAVLSFDTGLAPFQQLYILNPAAAGYFPAAFSLLSSRRNPSIPKIGLWNGARSGRGAYRRRRTVQLLLRHQDRRNRRWLVYNVQFADHQNEGGKGDR
jgi:hypothetical protein